MSPTYETNRIFSVWGSQTDFYKIIFLKIIPNLGAFETLLEPAREGMVGTEGIRIHLI